MEIRPKTDGSAAFSKDLFALLRGLDFLPQLWKTFYLGEHDRKELCFRLIIQTKIWITEEGPTPARRPGKY